jgi:hypothetical protein
MKQVRGPKHENWPVCDPRAARLGNMALRVVKMSGWEISPFFCLCVGMPLLNNISARKFSRRQIGG